MPNIEVVRGQRKVSRPRKIKPTMSAAEFLSRWFRRGDRIALVSISNDRDQTRKYPPRNFVTTNPATATSLIEKYDYDGRAAFFGVNPVLADERGKDHVAEIIGLHADIDLHGVVEEREAVLAALGRLRIKPTAVVSSGNGYHVYYRYHQPLPPEQTASHEALLKRLCRFLGADVAAAEVARVLRLPGSHNSKRGEWLDVHVINELSSWRSYRVDTLDGWIERHRDRPVLTYKNPPPDAVVSTVPLNPFQEVYSETRAYTSKGGLSPDELLARMRFHDVHGHGIDDSHMKIIGALVASGSDQSETIDYLLEPTRQAYERGKLHDDTPWNERKARRDIADKYRRLARKDAKRNGHG